MSGPDQLLLFLGEITCKGRDAVTFQPNVRGEVPTIRLMMGYNKSNTSTLLKRFLLRADQLVNRVSQGGAYSRTLKRSDRKPSV